MSTNITCASIDDQERLASLNFVISQFVDLTAAFITLSSSYTALQLVLKKSIFQWSTKILLLQNLFYANLFQLSYGLEASILMFKHFFMSDTTCEILQTEAHCAPYFEVILAAISGMIYGQTGLMVERTCATFLKNYKASKSQIIGCSISIIVLICSSITGRLLLWDDPLNKALLGCFMLPAGSAVRSNYYFIVCTTLTLFNLVISISLKVHNKRCEYSIRFKVGARFRKREAIESTCTIVFLALSLFIFMFIYSVGICVLRNLRHVITVADFNFWVVWCYTAPFTAMLLPLLLIYKIQKTRSNRVQLIIGITHEKQSQDGHIAQMKNMWN